MKNHKEEGEYEYASYHKGAENGKEEAHLETAILIQPLGEAVSAGSSEDKQPEAGGSDHEVSGDGCGDGGYCGGHWVRRSEGGHRHGEAIGEDPREEAEIGVCLGSWAFGPVSGVFTCATEAGSHFVPTH